ncbi:hypothetical protein [Burkholderia alba]|uniref:hypothetical protein n=1 Tax=Burkholderia alba TaxID=2683677 RepID=UPI002B0525E4|nr:hypothetical protein [Burkholderia alba]
MNLHTDFGRCRGNFGVAAVRGLPIEEKCTYVLQYAAEQGDISSYSDVTATFKNALQRTAFTSWLSAKVGDAGVTLHWTSEIRR